MPDEFDVFISYASVDRETVMPIDAALRELGLRVWRDHEEIKASYAKEITAAIGNSRVILFFASRAALASQNTLSELSLGRARGRPFVPVFLEEVDLPGDFEYFLTLSQRVEVHRLPQAQWITHICASLRAHDVVFPDMAARAAAAIAKQEEQILGVEFSRFHGGHPLTPYLIDRVRQEGEIRDILKRAAETHAGRPIVLFAHGRQPQALNEYADRLHKFTLPNAVNALQYLGFRQALKIFEMQWSGEGWESKPDDTLRFLRNNVLEKLRLTPRDWPHAISAEFARFDAVTVLSYHLHWNAWNESHLRTLKAFVLEWAELQSLPLGCPLIVVFAVHMYNPPRSPLALLRQPKTAATELPKFTALTSAALLVEVLTELGNVRKNDVDDWIRHVVRPSDASAMIRRFNEVLDGSGEFFGGDGVSMTTFVDQATKSRAMSVLVPERDGRAKVRW